MIKYNNEYSCSSSLLNDFVSLYIFLVELNENTCLMANFLPILRFGVNCDILPRKKSKTYFLINSSLIVLLMPLNFFSNIASEDGELVVCFLK